MLAPLEVPQRDGPVIPATGEPAPIGTHLERLHRPLMRFSLPHAHPAVHLPPAQPAVAASTDQQLPTRSPGHGRDYPRMPHKGAIACPPGRVALPALHLPHEELPALAATAPRGQPRTIGAPGHTRDDPVMPRQPQQLRPIRCVPHIHVAIITPADQPRPVRTPGHATDPGRELTAHPTPRALRPVPHQHALQNSSAGQALPVRTPGHPIEEGVGAVEVPENLDTGPCGWLPEPDSIIPPGTCQPAPIGTPPHAGRGPAMAAQQFEWRPTLHLPDSHHGIRAATSQLGAVWTPGHVGEGGRVALEDPRALRTFDIPETQRAIATATEQAPRIG